ncbi:cyclic pyranopterin monophosphate synthase-like [Oppia nitens]|uniref:cyclic pyranopterin monophosphate synthase-like n=1 Tax=Oppia nitens TaxID=1686743 RepID=UPI0023DC1DAC|nr:cyclic pyranopterin monophosphate synthase-like [Oppia nitens]
MVDVSQKSVSTRVAKAMATVWVGQEVVHLIQANRIKKGNVQTVATVAGIMAAKCTPQLIPMCHTIGIQSVDIDTQVVDDDTGAAAAADTIRIWATVKASGQTGVEMEALTAVSVAALTVYDMCKAVNRKIVINDIRLVSKTGGKSDADIQ